MKLEWHQLKSIAMLAAIFLSLIKSTQSQPFHLPIESNNINSNLPTLLNNELTTNQTTPLIVMYDVPMSMGIENLARQANINYLLDARLSKWWSSPDSEGSITHEPTINLRLKNVTAKQALLHVLAEHHLVLAENSLTSIARVTYTNQTVSSINFDFFENDSFLIPLIQFQDVPITVGLKNLARQAGIYYELDPKIGYGKPDKHGQIKAEPILSFRWEKVTAKQGFIAICENYNFVIVKDSITGLIVITTKD